MSSTRQLDHSVLVVGAGIAGLSCIEALFHQYEFDSSKYSEVILLSDTRLIKKITNYSTTGRQLETFDVAEGDVEDLNILVPEGLRFRFILGSIRQIDHIQKKVFYTEVTEDNAQLEISYGSLCLCIGSKPRLIPYSSNPNVDDRVIIIRDTDTVKELQNKLVECRKLVIVGNGGIGLELVSKISNCEKTWLIRDESIGLTFFDSGAAKFLIEATCVGKNEGRQESLKYSTYHEHPRPSSFRKVNYGPSLGPDWSNNLTFSGRRKEGDKLEIVYNDEVEDILEELDSIVSGNLPLRVVTKNKKEVYCDLVVVAIGVEPNQPQFLGTDAEKSEKDGGLLVDTQMRTSIDHIYAAGDVISCDKWNHSDLWFQMRLWTQARQMGYYAGRCIASHLEGLDPSVYFNFDCFTHCTRFFGYKLVLLGKYNGQLIEDNNFEVIARVNPNVDYIKLLINGNGRIIGAVLVGNSGLEETIENLIHDSIDVSAIKDQLLDNTVDIEDYFD